VSASARAHPLVSPPLPESSRRHLAKQLDEMLTTHENGNLSQVLVFYRRTDGTLNFFYSNAAPETHADLMSHPQYLEAREAVNPFKPEKEPNV
jgi:hypothetical protein